MKKKNKSTPPPVYTEEQRVADELAHARAVEKVTAEIKIVGTRRISMPVHVFYKNFSGIQFNIGAYERLPELVKQGAISQEDLDAFRTFNQLVVEYSDLVPETPE